jgi:hypothetical protein
MKAMRIVVKPLLSRRTGTLLRPGVVVFWLLLSTYCGQSLGQTGSREGGGAVLANGKQSVWKIVLRPGASSPEVLAANELAYYVKRISQAELTITYDNSPSKYVIQIDSGNGDRDGFDLTVTKERITIHGHTPRGVLYGAYQLLEDMGCRWYYIGELGEVTPRADKIELPEKKSSQAASFRERSVMVAYPSYYERFDEWIDFLTKMRINNIVIYGRSLDWWKANRERYLPHLQERQTIIEFGGHILPSFVPRELFDEHPEYFRMTEKGARTKDKNFCSQSGAIEILKKNTHDFFSQLPEITYFHIWADDLKGGGWCHCPKCKDVPSEDQNLIAMNAMAEVLAQVNPKASLALLAYHDTMNAPTIKPAPNLFLFHAPRGRCYRHAFNDPECRRNRDEYMKPWLVLHAMFQKTAPATIHEFNYYTDGLLDREMQPPQVETIPADARYFHSLNLPVHQNLMVCFRDWHSPPFSLVLFSRAAWNADVNGWEALEDFCRHYYGENLAGIMTDYYRAVEASCQILFNGDPIVGSYIDMTWPPLEPAMRRAKIAEAKQARELHQGLQNRLDRALETAPPGIIAERLSRERDVCELHQFTLELACCHFEGQFLGWQYINGSVGREDGQRAKDLLAEGIMWVEKINAWIARYPEEQKGLIDGWQSYWNSCTKVFAELGKKVNDKLSEEG